MLFWSNNILITIANVSTKKQQTLKTILFFVHVDRVKSFFKEHEYLEDVNQKKLKQICNYLKNNTSWLEKVMAFYSLLFFIVIKPIKRLA